MEFWNYHFFQLLIGFYVSGFFLENIQIEKFLATLLISCQMKILLGLGEYHSFSLININSNIGNYLRKTYLSLNLKFVCTTLCMNQILNKVLWITIQWKFELNISLHKHMDIHIFSIRKSSIIFIEYCWTLLTINTFFSIPIHLFHNITRNLFSIFHHFPHIL